MAEEAQEKKKVSRSPSTICSVSPDENQLSFDVINTDYSDLFVTDVWFETRDDLLQWVRTVATENQMVVVVKRSDNGGGTRKGRVLIGCEHGGEYREFKGHSNKFKNVDEEKGGNDKRVRKRELRTKKCGCLFLLRGKQVTLMGPWELEVVNGVHNHSIAKFPENVSTMKTLYNIGAKQRVGDRVRQSQMQYLLGKLEEYKYYFFYWRFEDTGDVRDLFFSHPTSIALLRSFPQVLLMECAYTTNKYKFPLMEIVGVTSTEMPFCVACVYLEADKEDNYTWACSTLLALMNESCLPTVIVTDREKALINAIESIFPGTAHFLCRGHINKNIMANCRKYLGSKDKWDEFISAWNLVVLAYTEELFNHRLQCFHDEFADYPKAVEYVIKNWVEPYGKRFVSYATDNIMHYGNTTMKRAETHYAELKRQLKSSLGSFETCWTKVHRWMEISHTPIKQSFWKSINVVLHIFRVDTYMSLLGRVSTNALKLIHNEIAILSEGVMDASMCRCIIRKTCGLPCAHELYEYVSKGLPVPLEMVDSYWRLRQDIAPWDVGANKIIDLTKKWEELMKEINYMFEHADYSKKKWMLRRFQEVVNLSTTSLTEPSGSTCTRGQPKVLNKKASIKRDPDALEVIDSSSP